MAQEKVNLKAGMAGSSAGRGRSAKTAVLKRASRKARRKEGRWEVTEARAT